MEKKLFLVLGNHLFPESYFRNFKSEFFYMAEDKGLCTHFKYHKHKIILFLSAMREFRNNLEKKGYNIFYDQLDLKNHNKSYEEKLKLIINKNKIKKIICFEIEDKFFEERILSFCKKNQLQLEFFKNPMFLMSREEFSKFLSGVKKPFMATFYQMQRKSLKILVDEKGKPNGGKWSFDLENRKKLPSNLKIPTIPKFNNNIEEVVKIVEHFFKTHPGESKTFWYPTRRQDVDTLLNEFCKKKLKNFGDYEDAINQKNDFLFHSLLSPAMNMGLITPKEIIDEVLRQKVPLNSIEGFVRQIVGWREFVRGIYREFSEVQDKENFWKHKRKLSKKWYQGNLGILPVDDAIKKVLKFSYNHHIERLMILSNFMLLCEIDPREVHRWFMEMYMDSSDWVMGPNVYGMGQFSDGGIFATKPYISGSNYILKMSDYKKGDWCDIWDGLYWRFIHKHRKFFQKNPRLGLMVGTLDKMDKTRKLQIFKAADLFLSSI
jgi:deoxyribodipyrimidine photolyase-related protein